MSGIGRLTSIYLQNAKGTPCVSRFGSGTIAYAQCLATVSHRFGEIPLSRAGPPGIPKWLRSGSTRDPKGDPKWTQSGSKRGPKWDPLLDQKGTKRGPLSGQKGDQKGTPFWAKKGSHFGPPFGAALVSKCLTTPGAFLAHFPYPSPFLIDFDPILIDLGMMFD